MTPTTLQPVAALFVRADSIYKTLPGVDAWDASRDARRFGRQEAAVGPVVAHPPCRAWGRLRQFAKPRHDEAALAPWAVLQVRAFGGVLEHPRASSLWAHCGLPKPWEAPDAWGGYTIEVNQFDFGHKAEKRTWLYIVGCPLFSLPPIPCRPGEPTHSIRPCTAYPRKPSVTKAEREHTPEPLALWLVETARRCVGQGTPGWSMPTPPHPGPIQWNHAPTADTPEGRHRLLKRTIQQRIARDTAERLQARA
jgi:hypothetical protein